jgi:hypothetical protein
MRERKQAAWLLGAFAACFAVLLLLGGHRLFSSRPSRPALPISTSSPLEPGADEHLAHPADHAPVQPVADGRADRSRATSRIQVLFRVVGVADGARATLELRRPPEPDAVRHSTDTDGTLELLLEPGLLEASAWTETGCSAIVHQNLGPEEERREVLVQLGPCSTVEGRVHDALRRLPIAGARISIGAPGRISTSTDAGGVYRLAWPRDGVSYGLKCEADGYAEDGATLALSPEGTWGLERGGAREALPATGVGVARVDFELLPQGTLLGRVVGPGAGPIAGAEVRVEGHYWRGQHAAVPNGGSATTEPDGSFAISGLAPDITHHLGIALGGFATARIAVPPSRHPVRDVGLIVLWAEAVLSGKLMDASGEPVESLEIRLEHPEPLRLPASEPASFFPRDATQSLEAPQPARTITTAVGSFRFTGLVEGRYGLEVRSDSRPILESALVLARSEQRFERVVLPESFLGIRGVVLRDDKPVQGAHVVLELRGTRSTLTAADGTFEFRGLSDATALYRVRGPWGPVVEARAGGPLVRLELGEPQVRAAPALGSGKR